MKAPNGKQYVTSSQTGEVFLIDSPEILLEKKMTSAAAMELERRRRKNQSSVPGKRYSKPFGRLANKLRTYGSAIFTKSTAE